MERRLPPLNQLRLFEAAARHCSFTKAAEELHVTPSAVSQQVKALEEWLGVSLFVRQARRLVPTEQAGEYLQHIGAALDRVSEATRRLQSAGRRTTLVLTAAPFFAAHWLVPRLWEFYERYPEIDVRISASAQLLDLAGEGIDIALRYGHGHYPGHEVRLLKEEWVSAVCTPRLLDQLALREPSDLLAHRLLQVQRYPSLRNEVEWDDWLAAAGVHAPRRGRTLFFSDHFLLIREVLASRGIGLVRTGLLGDELSSGQLTTLFDVTLPAGSDYYLVWQPDRWHRPEVRAFIDWVIAHFQESARADPGASV